MTQFSGFVRLDCVPGNTYFACWDYIHLLGATTTFTVQDGKILALRLGS